MRTPSGLGQDDTPADEAPPRPSTMNPLRLLRRLLLLPTAASAFGGVPADRSVPPHPPTADATARGDGDGPGTAGPAPSAPPASATAADAAVGPSSPRRAALDGPRRGATAGGSHPPLLADGHRAAVVRPPGGPPAKPKLIELRAAVPADADALARLEGGCFPRDGPWSAASVRGELSRPCAVARVAEEEVGVGGRRPVPVGYALGWSAGGEAELVRIAVAPDRRRGGLGAALLEGWVDGCRAAGAAEAFLEVRADNDAARALYRRHGFVEAGRRASYYGDGTDALVLRRRL